MTLPFVVHTSGNAADTAYMSIHGYRIVQLTNHYTVTRVGDQNWLYRDAWVRTRDGALRLAGIRVDLLDEDQA